jgi:hypothetical protein
MTDFAEEIKYWSDRINATDERLDALHLRLYAKPFVPLTLEESIDLRWLMEENRANSRFLAAAVASELKNSEPFWKKLFRKK